MPKYHSYGIDFLNRLVRMKCKVAEIFFLGPFSEVLEMYVFYLF